MVRLSSTDAFLPPPRPLGFYVVVPDAAWVKRVIDGGCHTVQLRIKGAHPEHRRQEIKQAIDYARRHQVPLYINDHWQDAIALGAHGVHLGQEDLDTADTAAIKQAGLRLGLSTHGDEELARALTYLPSYVAIGAIFPTTTKVMPTAPQGLERLARFVKQAGNTPTVAIGGIDLNNAEDVLATGVGSLAVVRAVTDAADPIAVIHAFTRYWTL